MERIPILQLGTCLLVSVQVDIHDRLALALQDDLATAIVATEAKGVLIDISALDVVDSFIGRVLGNVAATARVLDAHAVVVGMRPAVAITLVELGVTWQHMGSALNIEQGLAMLGVSVGGGPPAVPYDVGRGN